MKLTKVDAGIWKHGPYTVRRDDWADHSRYIVTGPGIGLRATHGRGSDIRSLAEARAVITAAKTGGS